MPDRINNIPSKPVKEISFSDVVENTPVGILAFKKDWKIVLVNSNFFGFNVTKGSAPADLLSKSILNEEIFEEIDIKKELLEIEKGTPFEKEIVSRQSLDGSKISVLVKGTPIYKNNEFNGGILIIEDIKIAASVQKESIIKSNSFYEFIENLSDYFIIANSSGKIIYSPSNDVAKKFELLLFNSNEKPEDIFSLPSSDTVRDLFGLMHNSKKEVDSEICINWDGDEITLQVTLVPYLDNLKNIQFIIVLLKDVTDERKEKFFLEKEVDELRKYQYIASSIVDALISVDYNGNITFWNEAAERLFGLPKSKVHGKFIGKIIPRIDSKYFRKLKEEIKIGKTWEVRITYGANEETQEYISIRIGKLGEAGAQSYVLLCSSITEKAKIERELLQSEERYRSIVTHSHEYICALDLEGNITYANPYFVKTFKYSREEFIGLNFMELIDNYFKLRKDFKFGDLKTKKPQRLELPLVKKGGEKVFVLASFSPVMEKSGEIKYYNAILKDITIQKEAEKDLMLIRSVFEASHDGIAVVFERKFVLVNNSLAKMFNYKNSDELLEMDPLDLIVNEDIPRIASYIQAVEQKKEAPTRYEFTAKKKDESIFYVENSVSSYEINESNFSVWVVRDVTEQRKVQQAVKESEERYRSITENIDEGFWTAERVKGKLKATFYTSAIKTITGFANKQFINDPHLWHKIIHPVDVENIVKKLNRFYKDTARNSEVLEYRIINSSGNVVWINNKINLSRDNKGVIQKIFGLVSDITLNKKAEEDLKKSTENLKDLNDAKDKFISIVSHDLRTPFSSILGFTDLLLGDTDMSEEKKKQYVGFIKDSAKNMLSLVNALLDWTRLQTGRIKFTPERVNVKNIVNNSFQILRGTAIQKSIDLVLSIDKDVYVHADNNLLLQVFNNLISNAIKFTRKNGKIIISAEPVVEKREIEFHVKDSGTGIKKEDIAKLFKVESKFTTPGTSGEKGSGLGLSLVQDIIKKHGGEIWVESEWGKGSDFIFTIPTSSTNILLVDDKKADRLLYSKLLKSILPKYEIIEAENGEEALEFVSQFSPAVVITEHKMPVMSGYEFVKKLNVTDLKLKPPLIILMRDINESIIEEYHEMGIEYVFPKPVNLTIFKNALDKSLRKSIYN